jgi:hypothetical protein
MCATCDDRRARDARRTHGGPPSSAGEAREERIMTTNVTAIRPDVVVPAPPSSCPVCTVPHEPTLSMVLDCDTCGAQTHHECYWGRVAKHRGVARLSRVAQRERTRRAPRHPSVRVAPPGDMHGLPPRERRRVNAPAVSRSPTVGSLWLGFAGTPFWPTALLRVRSRRSRLRVAPDAATFASHRRCRGAELAGFPSTFAHVRVTSA